MKWRRGKKKKNRQKEPRCWIGDPSGIVKPSLITKHAILPFSHHSLKTSTTRLISYKSDCVTVTALAAGCCTNNISQQETQQSLTAVEFLHFPQWPSDLRVTGSHQAPSFNRVRLIHSWGEAAGRVSEALSAHLWVFKNKKLLFLCFFYRKP